jgi:hypothetical protein
MKLLGITETKITLSVHVVRVEINPNGLNNIYVYSTYRKEKLSAARWCNARLIFDHEDGGDTLLRNVSSHADCTALYLADYGVILLNYNGWMRGSRKILNRLWGYAKICSVIKHL